MYIELVDMGFNATRKYYYSKLPTFNRYAASTSDTMLDTYELRARSEKIIQRRSEPRMKTNAPRIINPIYFRDERFFDYTQRDQKANQKPDLSHPINPIEWL